jgi:hypothetical protein
VHSWVQAAGKAAVEVLKQLDYSCKTLVLVGCLDEIFFHGRPVLVGVEPRSMVWFLGKNTGNCQGSTWFEELQPWTSLDYVVSDAGVGLQAGITQMQQHRRETEQVPLEKGLDVFHTKQEAQRVLRPLWNRVERLWEQAEAATRAVEKAQRLGRDSRGATTAARGAWNRASITFHEYEKEEAGWKQAELALSVFRPDGQLNDRSWAQGQVALALAQLWSQEWSKVRGFLNVEELVTFDRFHRQLGQLLCSKSRDARAHRGGFVDNDRRNRMRRPLGILLALVQQVLCQKLDPNWRESYRRVAAVLSQTVRASSAVECMNSVLRMHQSRHRTMTPGMLDLKRLYWNCRVFRGGKRKGLCPYEHLGLKLPSFNFWTLLHDETNTALAKAKAEAKAKANAA